MSETVGCVVVGAGVVGLAAARALARAGQEVLILEEAGAIGTATSSRSSEVIHAGLYYPPGSWRALLCVQGRRSLYSYCAAHGVAARALGKLVVATDADELAALDAIETRAIANGVEGLQRLDAARARALEPALRCTGALLSPVTGIVDSHALMLSLLGEAQDHGAMLALHAPVLGAETVRGGFVVHVGGPHKLRLRCRALVNAAGLGACALAARIAGLDGRHVPPAYLSKGSYFTLASRVPFRHLIYPVPIAGGAGIHLTLDLGGQARFGPDVEAVTQLDYAVDPAREADFAAAVRRYWPALPEGALRPAYAGIRPKIVPAAESQDFLIQDEAIHGVPGLLNLFGIESPGLTSCLALGALVAERVRTAG
jgi:L-2-hydroxyglutarate oxidase LhgO